jgi:hypothetical protein
MFKSSLVALAVASTSFAGTSAAQAAPPQFSIQIGGGRVAVGRDRDRDRDHRHYTVHYSTRGWKSQHLHDHASAHEMETWLRGVGCSVRVLHEGDHYDVMYTCSERTTTFESDRAAHRFEEKLERFGFAAHVHH